MALLVCCVWCADAVLLSGLCAVCCVQSGSASSSYVYCPLECLQPPGVVNVWGVVSSGRPVRVSKGKDWQLPVPLVDPSTSHVNAHAVVFNFFRKDPQLLPKLQAGDVVRIHRAGINTYQGSKLGGTVNRAAQFVCCRPSHSTPSSASSGAAGNDSDLPAPFFSSTRSQSPPASAQPSVRFASNSASLSLLSPTPPPPPLCCASLTDFSPLDPVVLRGLLSWSSSQQWGSPQASSASSASSPSAASSGSAFHRFFSQLQPNEFCDVTVRVLAKVQPGRASPFSAVAGPCRARVRCSKASLDAVWVLGCVRAVYGVRAGRMAAPSQCGTALACRTRRSGGCGRRRTGGRQRRGSTVSAAGSAHTTTASEPHAVDEALHSTRALISHSLHRCGLADQCWRCDRRVRCCCV